VACRLRQGETELGHQAHREPFPHGGEPAAAPPHLELFRADPCALTLRAHLRRRLGEPSRPNALALEPGIPLRQELLYEGAAAEVSMVGEQGPGVERGPGRGGDRP